MNDEPVTLLKRKPQGIWSWPEKIYVPCTLHMKNVFRSKARENGMSQAELGLVIVEQVVQRRELLDELIRNHRRTKDGL